MSTIQPFQFAIQNNIPSTLTGSNLSEVRHVMIDWMICKAHLTKYIAASPLYQLVHHICYRGRGYQYHSELIFSNNEYIRHNTVYLVSFTLTLSCYWFYHAKTVYLSLKSQHFKGYLTLYYYTSHIGIYLNVFSMGISNKVMKFNSIGIVDNFVTFLTCLCPLHTPVAW